MNTLDLNEVVKSSKASQNKEELSKLLHMVSNIEPRVVVEIGTWHGHSMETFYKAFNPTKLITIESDSTPLLILAERTHAGEFNYITPPPILIQNDSGSQQGLDLVKQELNGDLIDFLFIDGDHTYEAVKKDFNNYVSLVRDGGFIGFHDIALVGDKWIQAGVEVNRFWNEVKEHYQYWEFVAEDGTGTGTGLIQI